MRKRAEKVYRQVGVRRCFPDLNDDRVKPHIDIIEVELAAAVREEREKCKVLKGAAEGARSFIKGVWADKFISAEDEPVVFGLMINTLKSLDAALLTEEK